MGWTGNYITTSFKRDLLRGYHKLRESGGHTFKIALYDENASFNADTTDYTTTNEITAVGYTAGGLALTIIEPTTGGTTGYCDFADAVWSGTISARGALIYNTETNGGVGTTDAAVVLDFGATRTDTDGVFRVVMPTGDELNAIVRVN